MNNKLEIAQHIANRGSKALLGIESIGLKAKKVLESDMSAEAKVEALARLNSDIMTKVMEGTSDLYSIKKNA